MEVEVSTYYLANTMENKICVTVKKGGFDPSEVLTFTDFANSKKPVSNYQTMTYKFVITIPQQAVQENNIGSDFYLKHLTKMMEEQGFTDPEIVDVVNYCEKSMNPEINIMDKWGAKPSTSGKFKSGTKITLAEFMAKHKKADYGSYSSPGTDYSARSHSLPGIHSKLNYPCECNSNGGIMMEWDQKAGKWKIVDDNILKVQATTKTGSVHQIIMHLNDSHKWPREKIADWLDAEHDAGRINIEFDVPMDEPEGGES